MSEIVHREELVVETCWCGLGHAIPQSLAEAARKTGQGVYCPLGHEWIVGESEVDRLTKKAARLTARLDQERQRAATLEASRNALKGEITKAKKRASAGVCPCCNRSFVQLARHMKTKHPDFADADA